MSQGSSSQQAPSNASATHRAPTLQEAILSIPQIEDVLDQWESGEPETPLVQAQLSAHRVLSHPHLFQGPRGAVPRAKVQLRELAHTTAALQGKLMQSSADVKAKQQALQRSGQQRIDDLKTHNEKWPFFASFLKVPMAWAATIFALLFLCFPLVILGFVWLEQVFQQFVPGLSYWLGQPVFGISVFAPFYFLLVLTLVILLLFTIFGFGRWLLDSRRSALGVEIVFGFVLLAIAFTGGLLVLSSYGFITTPLGLAVLAWYPSVLRSWVSSLALFIFLVMVIVEIFYYSWWRKELEREFGTRLQRISELSIREM